jgi:DnaJ-class molecular chaperone
MEFACSRCHTKFAAQDEKAPERCPTCKAEAGLEAHHETPLAMKLFGAVLGCALLASIVGTVLALGRGA